MFIIYNDFPLFFVFLIKIKKNIKTLLKKTKTNQIWIIMYQQKKEFLNNL